MVVTTIIWILFGFLFGDISTQINVAVSPVKIESSGCGHVPADIVFVLDSSGSVGRKNFKKMLLFVEELVKNFEIGPDKTQIGLVVFSKNPHLEFHLNAYTTKGDTLHAIAHARYVNGGTQTHRALEFVREKSFLLEHGARDNTARIVIIITDGESKHRRSTEMEAMELRNDGITIFAIGVGRGTNRKELNAMATDPDSTHVFSVRNFNALKGIKFTLAKKTCAVPTSPLNIPSGSSLTHTEGTCLSDRTISFYAELSTDSPLGAWQTVVFGKVIANEGQDYNPEKGYFIAPIDGIYYLQAIFPERGLRGMHFELVQNNNELARTRQITAGQNSKRKSIINIVASLNMHDIVRVRGVYKKMLVAYGGKGSTFSGYLIDKLNMKCFFYFIRYPYMPVPSQDLKHPI